MGLGLRDGVEGWGNGVGLELGVRAWVRVKG